jgi:hypothetical protein
MNRMITRVLAGSLVFVVSGATEPLLAQQSSGQQSTGQPSAPASQQAPAQNPLPPIEMPENPGRTSNPNQAPATEPAATPVPAQTPSSTSQEPNGTAVAPPVEVSGGAASKPAGVAIAPPKQRQVRSLLIKLGFLAGAGAAIGTVVGLSAASPGHVPGSPAH